MEREKLVSMVVEEVVRALQGGAAPGRSNTSGAADPSGAQAGNARTRAAIHDYSHGLPSRIDGLSTVEGESTAIDRPAAVVGVSNRHIHLSAEDCARLFGPGRDLTVRNELRQPGEFAARETVTIITRRGRAIEGVRILGPLRAKTQVELSRTDCFYLGLKAPVRASGDHRGSPGIILVGSAGAAILGQGVIIADRHIHAPPGWAQRWGLSDQQMVSCRAGGEGPKPTILENVRIRVSPKFVLEAHLDTDDANAACLNNGDVLEVILPPRG